MIACEDPSQQQLSYLQSKYNEVILAVKCKRVISQERVIIHVYSEGINRVIYTHAKIQYFPNFRAKPPFPPPQKDCLPLLPPTLPQLYIMPSNCVKQVSRLAIYQDKRVYWFSSAFAKFIVVLLMEDCE